MRVYFDPSAYAKRYIDEHGTQEVLAWCKQATALVLSVIAIPELISALCRMRREARLTSNQYRRIKQDLMVDIADALICETTPRVIQNAVNVLEANPLRGMDAIHIGAALACSAEVFVSADKRQCDAAKKSGLTVVSL